MKHIIILSFMFFIVNTGHAFTSFYIGWENYISPVLPVETTADSAVFGILGNTPTRIYFHYQILANIIFTKGAVVGNLGWGLDFAGGIGYRFLNAAYKKSGWDVGMDIYGYLTPNFLNSETDYFEIALYYGVGLGLNVVYKINPYIGVGFRAGIKYNIGIKSLAAQTPSAQGILFTVGALITF